MQTKLILLLFISVLVLFSPNIVASEEQLSPQQSEVQGIPCSGKVSYHDNGHINTCILAREFTVSGNLLPAGTKLFFEPSGKIGRCILGGQASFYGQILPANSNIFFNEDGSIRSFWLEKDTNIQGHLIRASDDGIGNRLYTNGKLLCVWLAGEEWIEGIPCTSSGNIFKMGWRVFSMGTKRMAWFYPDGRLQQAMISQDITIQGHLFKTGDLIYLNPDGKINLNAKYLG